MMFKALATLLASSPTLILTLSRADEDRLRLTITPHRPKKKGTVDDDDDGEYTPEAAIGILARPLVIVGTIDELEVELPAHLERYAQTRTSLKEVFADRDREFEEAKKEADARVAAEKKRAAAGVPTITKPPLTPAKPKAPASIL